MINHKRKHLKRHVIWSALLWMGCPAKHYTPAFSDPRDVVDNSVQQVCFLTLLSHPDNIWLDSLLAIDARMLVLRATRTWAGAFLEASSRGNAHNALTNSAATNTFPGEPAWFYFLLQLAPIPISLPLMLVGKWGGGGRLPIWIVLSVLTVGLPTIGSSAQHDRILFYMTTRLIVHFLHGKWAGGGGGILCMDLVTTNGAK